MSDEDRIERERIERLRGESDAFKREMDVVNGIVDCFEALLLGLVDRKVVAPDFVDALIPELAARLSVWKQPTPEQPQGLDRAWPIEVLLNRLRGGLDRPALTVDERGRPN